MSPISPNLSGNHTTSEWDTFLRALRSTSYFFGHTKSVIGQKLCKCPNLQHLGILLDFFFVSSSISWRNCSYFVGTSGVLMRRRVFISSAVIGFVSSAVIRSWRRIFFCDWIGLADWSFRMFFLLLSCHLGRHHLEK